MLMCFSKGNHAPLMRGVFFLFGLISFASMVSAEPIRVLAITSDFASIAKFVGGDLVRVDTLVKGSRNLHNINPRPSMVVKARKADLLIRLGMAQDSWIDGVIQVAKNRALFRGQTGYLDCSLSIAKLEVPEGKIDGSMGDVHKEGNPHYWLSPKNGVVIASQIRDRLISLDPQNKQAFDENYKRFESEIKERLQVWNAAFQPYQNQSFLTYHKVWSYFFDAFSLKSLGELEPLPGIPPTTRHLAELNKMVRAQKQPPMIIIANYYPKKAGDLFAKQIGSHQVVLKPHAASVAATAYFDLFDDIISALTR